MERIPSLVKKLDDLERETEQRHEANERRFDKIEIDIAKISSMLKLATAILIADGILSIAHLTHG